MKIPKWLAQKYAGEFSKPRSDRTEDQLLRQHCDVVTGKELTDAEWDEIVSFADKMMNPTVTVSTPDGTQAVVMSKSQP